MKARPKIPYGTCLMIENYLPDFRGRVFNLHRRIWVAMITIHSPAAKPCHGMKFFLCDTQSQEERFICSDKKTNYFACNLTSFAVTFKGRQTFCISVDEVKVTNRFKFFFVLRCLAFLKKEITCVMLPLAKMVATGSQSKALKTMFAVFFCLVISFRKTAHHGHIWRWKISFLRYSQLFST